MKRWILALACVTFSMTAAALDSPQVVGIHVASIHSDDGKSAPEARGWNNENYGVYARWGNGLTIGEFKNSLYKQSVYIGKTWSDPDDRFSITVGAISGYDVKVSSGGELKYRCQSTCQWIHVKERIFPLIAPSVRVGLSELGLHRTSLRMTVVKSPGPAPWVLHFSVEQRF